MKYNDMIFGAYSAKSNLSGLLVHHGVKIEIENEFFWYIANYDLNEIFKYKFCVSFPKLFESHSIMDIKKINDYMRVNDYKEDCIFIGSENIINSLEHGSLIPTNEYAIYLFKDSTSNKSYLKNYIKLCRLLYLHELKDIQNYFEKIRET